MFIPINSGTVGGIRWTDVYLRHWQLVFGSMFLVLGISIRLLLAVGARVGFAPNETLGARALSGGEPWVSTLAILIGSILMARYLYVAIRNHLIRRNGERLTAAINCVEEDPSTTVNYEHPKRIIASAKVGGVLREFRSKAFAFDPTDYLKSQEINHLTLYVYPQKPSVYVMDTSFLTGRDPFTLTLILSFWNFMAVLGIAIAVFLS